MSVPDIELVQNTYDRLVQIPTYYFNKPNLKVYLEAVSIEFDELYKALYDLRYLRDIDSATGINLDNIGQIVGEPRGYSVDFGSGIFTLGETLFDNTGFDDGQFSSIGDNQTVHVTREDDIYRRAIKAKIYRNNGYGTPEEIIALTKMLTGANSVVFVPEYPAGCSLYYDIEMDDIDRVYFYDFIQAALPAGVKLNNFKQVPENYNFISGTGICVDYSTVDDAQLDKAEELGVKYIRLDCKWAFVESSLGVYDWTTYDSIIADILSRDMIPVLVLGYNNTLYGASGELYGISDQTQLDGFVNFCKAAIEKYKNNGIIWEIWNEPNADNFWLPAANSSEYIAMAKSVISEMRDIDEEAIIIAPSLAFIGDEDGISFDTFLDDCGSSGLLKLIDAISVHPYQGNPPEDATYEGDIDGGMGYLYSIVRETLIKYYPENINLPIIASEFGYSNTWGLTNDEQSDYITRKILYNSSHGVDVSIVYDLVSGTDSENPEDNYGLLNSDLSEKSAFVGIKTLNTNLNGAEFVEIMDSPQDNYYLKYTKGENTIYVLWTTGAENQVEIDGNIVNLTSSPTYLIV